MLEDPGCHSLFLDLYTACLVVAFSLVQYFSRRLVDAREVTSGGYGGIRKTLEAKALQHGGMHPRPVGSADTYI